MYIYREREKEAYKPVCLSSQFTLFYMAYAVCFNGPYGTHHNVTWARGLMGLPMGGQEWVEQDQIWRSWILCVYSLQVKSKATYHAVNHLIML